MYFEVGGVRVGMEFSFPAVVGLMSVTGGRQWVLLMGLGCCVLHEAGHLLFMVLFGAKPAAVVLYGGGFRITPGRATDRARELIILSAGSGVNLLCAGVGAALGAPAEFRDMSLLLGVFNLLPLRYFDGGRIVELLFGGIPPFIRAGAAAGLGAAIILMGAAGRINPSLILTFGFIAVSELI